MPHRRSGEDALSLRERPALLHSQRPEVQDRPCVVRFVEQLQYAGMGGLTSVHAAMVDGD